MVVERKEIYYSLLRDTVCEWGVAHILTHWICHNSLHRSCRECSFIFFPFLLHVRSISDFGLNEKRWTYEHNCYYVQTPRDQLFRYQLQTIYELIKLTLNTRRDPFAPWLSHICRCRHNCTIALWNTNDCVSLLFPYAELIPYTYNVIVEMTRVRANLNGNEKCLTRRKLLPSRGLVHFVKR